MLQPVVKAGVTNRGPLIKHHPASRQRYSRSRTWPAYCGTATVMAAGTKTRSLRPRRGKKAPLLLYARRDGLRARTAYVPREGGRRLASTWLTVCASTLATTGGTQNNNKPSPPHIYIGEIYFAPSAQTQHGPFFFFYAPRKIVSHDYSAPSRVKHPECFFFFFKIL